MPISLSAKKSLRKSIKNRKANVYFKDKLKLVMKKFLGKPTEENFQEAQSMLDKAKKKGLIHKNKVARVKSQFTKKIGTTVTVTKKTTKKAPKKVAKKTTKKSVKKM